MSKGTELLLKAREALVSENGQIKDAIKDIDSALKKLKSKSPRSRGKRVWTEEQKELMSEKMRQRWAEKKAA